MSEWRDEPGGEGSRLATFRVRQGVTFGARSEHGSGSLVQLPISVLVAFGDKLELVETAASETSAQPSTETAEEATSARRKAQR